ncbi:hypothetical protein HN451_03925 [archaeon]|nr:hypothetical protein [archaeon]
MKTIDFKSEKNLFGVIQKALGKSSAKKFKFTISKENREELDIQWNEEYIE